MDTSNKRFVLSATREKQVIELCQEMIRAQSYSGQEDQVVEKLKNAMLAMGFTDFYIDDFGSIIGHIKGHRPGPKLLFDGHLDTVPVPDPTDWTHDPFGGEIDDGKIYGRGTSDMKGALAAMACGAAWFAEDCRGDFSGDLYVVGSVHEECFEGVSSRIISKRVQPDYVVIGEASLGKLKRGQKGRAEIVVETACIVFLDHESKPGL